MAEFINTVDVIGDDALVDSIIDRTITEFKDNVITKIEANAFTGCNNITDIIVPNAAFVYTNEGAYGGGFNNLPALKHLKIKDISPVNMCQNCSNLRILDIGRAKNTTWYFGYWSMVYTSNLRTLILRSETNVCEQSAAHFNTTGIAKGKGCIYVPAALIEDYKAATNWSVYADRFRTIEDWSVDGTVTGDIILYEVSYTLSDVESSNIEMFVKADDSYSATLTAAEGLFITGANIFMGGIDITEDVYNAETGEIYIPVVTGDIVIDATCDIYTVTNKLTEVENSNGVVEVFPRSPYSAVLTPYGGISLGYIHITMGGIDITEDVYNAETGEIYIPVVTGDIMITASIYQWDIMLYPYDGTEEGDLPFYVMNVSAGMVLTIEYYLTKNRGYVYDGRDCGLNYVLNSNVVNETTVMEVTIPVDGRISFSSYRGDTVGNGNLGSVAADRLYGKYFFVRIS